MQVVEIPSVFIAEDEDELRSLFKELLESKGYEVCANVGNGQEILEQYASLETDPNLFILDHRMPGKSGLEASREILKTNPEARILFMSGDNYLESEVQGKSNMGLILKPFLLSTFLNAVYVMIHGTNHSGGNGGAVNIFHNK